MEEKQDFKAEIEKLIPQQKEGVMEIVTSWKKEGLEEGLVQGLRKASGIFSCAIAQASWPASCGGGETDRGAADRPPGGTRRGIAGFHRPRRPGCLAEVASLLSEAKL